MKLYTVSVIDSSPRAKNAKVLVHTYATIATSAIEAAGNISRENSVLPADKVIVKECENRSIPLHARFRYQRELIMRVVQDGMEFTGAELPAREDL